MFIKKFLDDLNERVLVFDGAMGSNLQTQNLTAEDFGGKFGCSEALILFAPHAVRKVHCDFLKAGCRAVETNTFGATRITLSEYGLENRVAEINKTAVKIAREAVEEAGKDGPFYIAASIGPTSKLPTLGQISYDEMACAYQEQTDALAETDVDIYTVETCQDILQTKAALNAVAKTFSKYSIQKPVMVSVTVEPAGTMLLGTDIAAVAAIIEQYDFVQSLGINCATGPLEMIRHVEYLSRYWPRIISVMPNAGLPENVNGKAFYRLTPEELAQYHYDFVRKSGVNIVGGCCGTTPAHLEAVAKKVKNLTPAKRTPESRKCAASLYQAMTLNQEPPPCFVGERTNANGSKQFRDLLLKDDWDGMVAMAKDQAKGGAHLLDICTAYVGRNEKADMEKFVSLLATQIRIPLMIDSTEPEVVEAVLKRYPGHCIINSVNMEDSGKKALKIAALAKEFSAMIVCLTIDENGMAKTAESKLAIAKRLFEFLTVECKLRPKDLIFDPLTFTLASGDPVLRSSALETLKAIELINREFPESSILLGVSNVSFGLKPEAREVLNSIFLAEAVKKGLTMSIVYPKGIIPTFKIPSEIKELALNLIYNKGSDRSELSEYMQAFAGERNVAASESLNLSASEKLRLKIIDGDKNGLQELLDEIRKSVKPVNIVNELLIPAMREVGELFGKGEIQLPFVLQSAEAMKASVSIIEPFMDKSAVSENKKVILATVQGDVHDIGKNLVSILLSNNGFQVIDLGIKVDIDTMIRAAAKHDCKIIGMSGLLVRSTQIMKENLEELNRRGLTPSIILGGAALTKKFVEEDLAAVYKGKIYYAQDAFSGLKIISAIFADQNPIAEKSDKLCESIKSSNNVKSSDSNRFNEKTISETNVEPADSADSQSCCCCTTAPEKIILSKNDFSEKCFPPFFGKRIIDVSVEDLLKFVDKDTLFKFRWQYKRGNMDEISWKKLISEEVEECYNNLVKYSIEKKLFTPRICYGYFKCQANKDKLTVYRNDGSVGAEWSFPRSKKESGLCLTDFFSGNEPDVIPLWCGTVGPNALEEARFLYENGNYRDYLHLHGLCMELAECCAEWAEEKIVSELKLRIDGNKKRGIRFSFGYPSCPDLTDQEALLNLVGGSDTQIAITDICELIPECSVTGIYVHNPKARYFIP
ncbi:MAG: methionine synthase [Candidatus Riflebacteria bacterium]|nr:methionine synthase [Candidatus Riflebacteria bacterium]